MGTAKKAALATATGVIVFMQAAFFSLALDLVSSLLLFAIGYAAGRFWR